MQKHTEGYINGRRNFGDHQNQKNGDGDIIDVMLNNGNVYSIDEAIMMAKVGLIRGVNVSRAKNGREYLRSDPNDSKDDNLTTCRHLAECRQGSTEMPAGCIDMPACLLNFMPASAIKYMTIYNTRRKKYIIQIHYPFIKKIESGFRRIPVCPEGNRCFKGTAKITGPLKKPQINRRKSHSPADFA